MVDAGNKNTISWQVQSYSCTVPFHSGKIVSNSGAPCAYRIMNIHRPWWWLLGSRAIFTKVDGNQLLHSTIQWEFCSPCTSHTACWVHGYRKIWEKIVCFTPPHRVWDARSLALHYIFFFIRPVSSSQSAWSFSMDHSNSACSNNKWTILITVLRTHLLYCPFQLVAKVSQVFTSFTFSRTCERFQNELVCFTPRSTWYAIQCVHICAWSVKLMQTWHEVAIQVSYVNYRAREHNDNIISTQQHHDNSTIDPILWFSTRFQRFNTTQTQCK